MDRVLPFFHDLWLWIDDPPTFQMTLRRELGAWTPSADAFYEDAGELNHVVSTWFAAQFGLERFAYLTAWLRRLYGLDGSARAAEYEWRNIAIEMGRSPLRLDVLDKETRRAITQLREAHAAVYQSLEARVDAAGNSPLTSWDSDVLNLDFDEGANDWGSHAAHTTVRIMRIADYNAFLELWDRICGQLSCSQLRSLHDVGKVLATGAGLAPAGDEDQIHFPGSWQPEVRWFLGHRR